MKAEWNTAGDVIASKQIFRDLIQHNESALDAEIAEGEIAYNVSGEHRLKLRKDSGIVHVITSDDDILGGSAPIIGAPGTPQEGGIYWADGVHWDPLDVYPEDNGAPYGVYYSGGQYLPITSAQFSQSGAARNLIVNGNFSVHQRGVDFHDITEDIYTLDRWMLRRSANYAPDVNWINYQAAGMQEPVDVRHMARISESGANPNTSDFVVLEQRYSMERNILGGDKTLTISFMAKSASPQVIALGYNIYYGDPGSASAAVGAPISGSTGIPLTTAFKWFSYTFTIPSQLGKVLSWAPGADPHIAIRFYMAGGSALSSEHGVTGGFTPASFTIDITNVKVEAGLVATPYSHTDAVDSLACYQRYLRLGGGMGFVSSPGSDARIVLMLAAPTGDIHGNARWNVLSWPQIRIGSINTVLHTGTSFAWEVSTNRGYITVGVDGYNSGSMLVGCGAAVNSEPAWLELEDEIYMHSESPKSGTFPT